MNIFGNWNEHPFNRDTMSNALTNATSHFRYSPGNAISSYLFNKICSRIRYRTEIFIIQNGHFLFAIKNERLTSNWSSIFYAVYFETIQMRWADMCVKVWDKMQEDTVSNWITATSSIYRTGKPLSAASETFRTHVVSFARIIFAFIFFTFHIRSS